MCLVVRQHQYDYISTCALADHSPSTVVLQRHLQLSPSPWHLRNLRSPTNSRRNQRLVSRSWQYLLTGSTRRHCISLHSMASGLPPGLHTHRWSHRTFKAEFEFKPVDGQHCNRSHTGEKEFPMSPCDMSPQVCTADLETGEGGHELHSFCRRTHDSAP